MQYFIPKHLFLIFLLFAYLATVVAQSNHLKFFYCSASNNCFFAGRLATFQKLLMCLQLDD
jgi:hypothetical protein